jgi:protein-tyrosine kinase
MSKIHEALKKAQQERESNLLEATRTVGPIAAPADTIHHGPGSPVMPDGFSMLGRHSVQAQEDFVRFDQLIERCAKPVWRIDPGAMVFSEANEPSAGAEQFRILRTRLYHLRESRPLRSLVITSALAGEGKTFVAGNLAQVITRQRSRGVLLIDGDLRCSQLHLPLGAPSAPGLSDYLRGEAGVTEIVQHGRNENLCFIPGGNPVSDPAELILNGRLKDLVGRLTPTFDWIIFDSPPTLAASDASILADLCDGVLFVLRAASTSFDAALKASSEFRERNLIGVVLNRVEAQDNYYSGYSSYEYSRERKAE